MTPYEKHLLFCCLPRFLGDIIKTGEASAHCVSVLLGCFEIFTDSVRVHAFMAQPIKNPKGGDQYQSRSGGVIVFKSHGILQDIECRTRDS